MFFIRNDLYADINNHIVDKIAVGILINQEFAECKSTQYIIICHMIAKKSRYGIPIYNIIPLVYNGLL